MTHDTRVAIVTGGTGGIGTAVVRMLARRGFRIVIPWHTSERVVEFLTSSLTAEC